MKVEAYQDVVGNVHRTRKESNISSVIHILRLGTEYEMCEGERRALAVETLEKLPALINVERDKS